MLTWKADGHRPPQIASRECVARGERRGCFVTIFNDLGERYFSTRLWD